MDHVNRRTFLRGLAGTPIAWPQGKNRRGHHPGERLYHGPMRLPSRVLDIATRAPVYRTTARHPVIRMALDDITYLFRCGIAGECYLGEIIRTDTGSYRVHMWTMIAEAPWLGEISDRHGLGLPQSAREREPSEKRY